ncbi:hypothetical protein BZG36_03934 [Bifiguratus adelaidae]|uniref:Uncharacterized protein n=1 Tax=Bifiguratus adelaidae TaxID=1938954 RepID=A0A261XZ52_9FUNG|nr:hypothetical protein BZG36_03934 [Bifiguratus adelaidae]
MIQTPDKAYPPMDLRRYTLADTVVWSGPTSTASSKIFRRLSLLQDDVIESASPSMSQMSPPMSSRRPSLSTELVHQTQVRRLSQEETARTQPLVSIEEMTPPPLTSSANDTAAIASLSQKPSVTEIPLGTAN